MGHNRLPRAKRRPTTSTTCLRRLAGALLTLATLSATAPAQAQAYYGWYGYESFGYGPAPIYVSGARPLLQSKGQYYDVTLRGVRRLCGDQPELCEEPNFHARLRRLEHERVAGVTLAWTGMATAVLGPLISTSVNCARSNTTCRPNDWVVLGTVVGGLAVGITGLAITPSVHNVVDLVNDINRKVPEHPVQLHFGALDPTYAPRGARAAHVAVAASF